MLAHAEACRLADLIVGRPQLLLQSQQLRARRVLAALTAMHVHAAAGMLLRLHVSLVVRKDQRRLTARCDRTRVIVQNAHKGVHVWEEWPTAKCRRHVRMERACCGWNTTCVEWG